MKKSCVYFIVLSVVIIFILGCSSAVVKNKYKRVEPQKIEKDAAPYHKTSIKITKAGYPTDQPSIDEILKNLSIQNDFDRRIIQKMYNDAPVGAKIEIEVDRGINPATTTYDGVEITMKSDKSFNSGGVPDYGANQAATKDKGITEDAKGIASVGGSKSQGILEDIWMKIKNWGLWLLGGGGLSLTILVGLLYIPAMKGFASQALRVIAAFIPGLGSIVEKTVANKKLKRPLSDVIEGGQAFKKEIKENSHNLGLTDKQKQQIIDTFNKMMQCKQDKNTQKTVDLFKIEKKQANG